MGGGSLTAENIRSTPDSFAVLMGHDALVVAGLLVGCVPRLVADICVRFQAGDLCGVQQAQEKLAPLRRAFAWGTFSCGGQRGCRSASKTFSNAAEATDWQKRHDSHAPKQGDQAPDFELRDAHGRNPARLSQLWNAQPVALVFGSFT